MKLFERILFVAAALLSAAACTTSSGGDGIEGTEFRIVTPAIDVARDTAKASIEFYSPNDWRVESDYDWIVVGDQSGSASAEKQTVEFALRENTTGAERVGLITVDAGADCYDVVKITQSESIEKSVSALYDRIHAENFGRVYICAHRANTWSGTWGRADCPENSIPAIERAIEVGMDMVELDVRRTKDGVLVLCHDTAIQSTTTGTGYITDLTYDEICRYDMRLRVNNNAVIKGVHIPRLVDALKACKGRIFVNLDLAKTSIPAAEVVAAVREADMMDEVTFYTGSDADLAKSYCKLDRRIAPHLSITTAGATASLAALDRTPLYQINCKYYNGTSGTTALSEGIRSNGFCSFSNHLDYDEAARKNGNTEMLEKFVAARIDFLQSDYGDCPNIQNYLKSKGLR
ncbi:MAG: hypothetical protein J6K28_00370 [Alistipes sp.]|nr:hypothetical protein [Alistipes sp.]